MSLWVCKNCGTVVRPKIGNTCPRCGKNTCGRVFNVQKLQYINVYRIINDDNCITHEQADLVADAVLNINMLGFGWTPVLDFYEIYVATGCFMGRLMGRLREACPKETLKTINIVNAVDSVEATFNSAKNFALELYDENVAKALEQTMIEMSRDGE